MDLAVVLPFPVLDRNKPVCCKFLFIENNLLALYDRNRQL